PGWRGRRAGGAGGAARPGPGRTRPRRGGARRCGSGPGGRPTMAGRPPAPATATLLVREGQDDGIQADDAVLVAGDVEVVALHLFRALFERDDRVQRGHLAKRVRPLVEAVAARDDLAVADRRPLGTVNAHVGGSLGHQLHQEVDTVDLDRYGAHRPPRSESLPIIPLHTDSRPLEVVP